MHTVTHRLLRDTTYAITYLYSIIMKFYGYIPTRLGSRRRVPDWLPNRFFAYLTTRIIAVLKPLVVCSNKLAPNFDISTTFKQFLCLSALESGVTFLNVTKMILFFYGI